MARRGGNVAKKARSEVEKELGKSTISGENYIDLKGKKLVRLLNE